LAEVPMWHLFAYFNADVEGERDEHRTVPEWRIDDAVRWARFRGYDAIMLTRTGGPGVFTRSPRMLEHEFPAQ